jgi:hypothetical protein
LALAATGRACEDSTVTRLPILLLALVAAAPARGATALAATVEELARASDAVVRGTVEGQESRSTADGRQIYTFVTVRPAAVWRGSVPARLVVRVPGGAVGRIGMRVPGAPAFAAGEEVVLFLRRSGAVHQVTGLAQGKFRVVGERAAPDLRGLFLAPRDGATPDPGGQELALAELERRVRSAR